MPKRTCSIDGCDSPYIARGWCSKHYQHWKRHGDPVQAPLIAVRLCSVDGCDRPHEAHGYCGLHYRRWRIHGDALWVPIRPSAAERFWAKVVKSDGCWEFVNDSRLGYGAFSVDSRPIGAHVFSWQLHNGPIPDGLFVCHHCDNPPCIRPEHLFLSDALGNMRDMAAKGRALKSHCRRGHPFDEANTYIAPSSGQRVCRACWKVRAEMRRKASGR